MSSAGAAPRAAVAVSSARAEASRKNGAKSRGPKTLDGKARSAQNALKHGMRAQKHLVLADEDGAEFGALEAALVAELAPVGALQIVLARRVAVAAWRLARADRIEVELFEQRQIAQGGPGLALIRDGNGTRSFETLLRYRGAALAELWRALRLLKALQAEHSAGQAVGGHVMEALPNPLRPRAPGAPRPEPSEPERDAARRLQSVISGQPVPGRTLHEPAAPWLPNQPETCRPHAAPAPAPRRLTANEPETRRPDAAPAPAPRRLAANEPETRRPHAAPAPAPRRLAANEPDRHPVRATGPNDNGASAAPTHSRIRPRSPTVAWTV